jgi:DnaK suppressor protein
VDDARARLTEELAATQRRLDRLTADFDEVVAASKDTNADDEHDPEGATIAFERAQVSAVRHATREHLAEVRAAIGRLDAGKYGLCERCGLRIPDGRLEARPTARRCVACASA